MINTLCSFDYSTLIFHETKMLFHVTLPQSSTVIKHAAMGCVQFFSAQGLFLFFSFVGDQMQTSTWSNCGRDFESCNLLQCLFPILTGHLIRCGKKKENYVEFLGNIMGKRCQIMWNFLKLIIKVVPLAFSNI